MHTRDEGAARARAGSRPMVGIAVGIVVLAGVALRLWTRSDLWLDEALSVHIAQLPLADIPEALRHDGHPPLYYFLLHLWMRVFGDGDVAVRSLSALFALAALPLSWWAGRSSGGPGPDRARAAAALLLLATSGYAIRYATEARMYSLVVLLVFAGWAVLRRALDEPRPLRLAALGLVAGLLLLTHYWAIYLLAATASVLVWAALRGPRRVAARRALGGTAAGGVLFLPWLPSFWYQARHTGTPWTEPERPGAVLARAMEELGGGGFSEARLLGTALVVLVLLGLLARAGGPARLELDLRTVPDVRPEAAVAGLTLGLAVAAGYATQTGFAGRYLAVVLPLVVIVSARGVAALPGGYRVGALAVVAALGLAAGAHSTVTERTQGGQIGRLLADGAASGDVVAFCPDQLGPAVARHLPSALTALTFPEGAPPERVDWVDYEDRNRAARADEFGREVLERAGRDDVWLVWAPGYRTLGTKCEELATTLAVARPGRQVVAPREVFEGMQLVHHPAP